MEDYSVQKPNKSRIKIASLAAGLGLAAVLVLVAIYLTKVHHAQSSDSYPVAFEIKPGATAQRIGRDLTAQKLIGSPVIFWAYTYINHAAAKIQAGQYQLDRNMSIAEIVDVITHGRVIPSDRSVTIIEGWTNDQIARNLAQKNVFAEVDFQHALTLDDFNTKFSQLGLKFNYQGFLYPDTYKIGKTDLPQDLIEKMLRNFEVKLGNQALSGDQLIVASIIEKEVGRNKEVISQNDLVLMQKERELVASVFYNRLRIGMGLESDATVNYITGKADRSVTIADTKIKSPYNTYQVKGLPPTPISNPGIGSIRAAIFPAESDYFYFLNAPEGTAYFAKTLAEHNANKVKYLK